MRINWHLYVFVQATLALIAGIICFRYLDNWPVLSALLCSFAALFLLQFRRSQKPLILKSILLMSGFLILGMLRSHTNQQLLHNNHYSNYEGYSSIIGTVLEFPKKRTRAKTTINVESVCYADSCIDVKGLVLLYFPKDDSTLFIEPGYQLLLRGKPIEIKAPTNPMTFDFKSYLANRHIHHQVYLNKVEDYRVLSKANLPYIYQLAHRLRTSMIAILNDHIEDPKNFSVAAAMILGYRNQLSEGLYQEFTNTGAVHVLAVSGLHVGIVCMIFVLILKRWKSKSNSSKLIKIALLSFIIWSFVLITGAAPAVVRAAFMFTLLLIGKYWFDHYKTINIMAFAAMVMLLYDPSMLFQASFQFSYISLLSIVLFQPWISALWVPWYKLIKFLWNLINVSIAAQVLVFPITLLFFHKFPLLFVVTGVIAVPLAMLILTLGLIILLSHLISLIIPFTVVLDFMSMVINGVLDGFLYAIHWINLLPYSSKDGIWISTFETLLLYGVIGSITAYVLDKRIKYLYFTGSLILIFLSQLGYKQYHMARQQKLVVYDSPKGILVDVINGRQVLTYQDANLTSKDISFIAKNYRDYSGIKDEIDITSANAHTVGVAKVGNDIIINNQSIHLGTTDLKIRESTTILLAGTPLDSTLNLPDSITMVILLSNLKLHEANRWVEYLNHKRINYRNANDEAVLIDL